MTQNDREMVNKAIELCDIACRGGLGKVNNNPLVQTVLLADRLLKERENAETVYQYATKVGEPWSSEDNYYQKEQGLITTYSDGSHDFIHSTTIKKGIWIQVEEAE
ncbi:hypothetical protein HB904_03950 [Listeria booriae]|uniref:Uncharacterized protein n=1 Tax=Listeria booriae TaxID=1552123 RepID=A0A842AGC7_9LIST|nr:hypothetical protein [Listeria booriae]MBC1615325.1 hypothetical protein [Listeria booriae]